LDQEGPALVVAPSSLGGVWKEQALRWLPKLRASEVQLVRGMQDRPLPQARIVIVSYAVFVKGAKGFSRTYRGDEWQIVACDEAHYLRNPTSQRAKALLPVLRSAPRCVLVTGTPAPKQASEAYSLLHALRPLGCSFQEWCSRYGSERTEHREAEVAALLSEVMVRRMKADVMDQLPPKHRQRILLQLPGGKAGALKRLQADSQGQVGDEEYFRQLASLKEAAAQDYAEYLIDASGKKFLLFAHHISMLDALESTCRKREVGCIRIDGSTPVDERLGLVHRFQSDPSCRVAVLAVLAAGEGLTLTAASLCVFCELCPAVPGVIEQAEARVHRIGQQAAGVDVHFLVVDGTRDDRVFARLEARTGAVARAVGDATDAGRPADPAAELDALFSGPSAPLEASARRPPTRRASARAGESVCEPPKKKRKPGLSLESVLSAGISKLQAELSEEASLADVARAPAPAAELVEASRKARAAEAPAREPSFAGPASRGRAHAKPRASRRPAARRRVVADSSDDAPLAAVLALPVVPHEQVATAATAANSRSLPQPEQEVGGEEGEEEEEAEVKAPSWRAARAAAPVAEDEMDAALSFFTSDARASRMSPAVAAAPGSEDTAWLRWSEEGSPAAWESSAGGGQGDRPGVDPSADAGQKRPPDPAATAPPAPAPAPRGAAEDPLAALLDGLIDAAREEG